jgi:hypothetical protein
MMTLSVRDLLIDAMSTIGTVAIDETPTDSELNLAMRVANILISRWASMPNMLRSTDTVKFTTVEGKSKYSIGEDWSDIPNSKPLKITSAHLTDTSNISTGRPTILAYNPGTTQQYNQTGTIILYLPPDQSYTVRFECTNDVDVFDDLDDDIEFEPVYYEALKYSIALRLFRHYHSVTTPIPVDIVALAKEAVDSLKAMNSRTPLASTDFGKATTVYNVYTDQ